MINTLVRTKKRFGLSNNEKVLLKSDVEIKNLINSEELKAFTDEQISELGTFHKLAERIDSEELLFLPPEAVYFDAATTLSMLVETVKDIELSENDRFAELKAKILEFVSKFELTRII